MTLLSGPLALTVIRVAIAAVLIIHGIARAALGIVDDFGGALTSWGLPAGVLLAWAITVVEIGGGLALAAGWAVPAGRRTVRSRRLSLRQEFTGAALEPT